MTVVEFVIASFILFFVLTAVLGLIGVTTKTSVIAKQRVVMTNAVASYIDYARGLPFYAVELRSVSASGALDSTVTTTSAGFTVTLTTTVRDADDGTKEMRVQAVCTAPGYPTMTTSAFAAIRNSVAGMTTVAPEEGPRIYFGSQTPPQNTVVWGSYASGFPALWIDADAECDEGELSKIEFMAEGVYLRNGSGDEAHWIPGSGTTTDYRSIIWDTQQVDTTTTVPAIQDGWRIVRVEAVDSLGRHAQKERRFLVDNYPPADPGEPRAIDSGWKDTTVLLRWDPAYDGTDPAYRYTLDTFLDHPGASTLAHWTSAGSFTLTQPAHTLTTSAFSRYSARVQAVSPLGNISSWVSTDAPFYSRPLVTGSSSCTVTGKLDARASNVTVQIATCSPPTFSVSSISYDLYRGTSPATLALHKSSISFPYTETIVDVIGKTGSPIAYYYQVVPTFTPSGWAGGTTETIRSNVVGPTAAVDGGSGPLGQVW